MGLKDGTYLYEDFKGWVPYGHMFLNEKEYEVKIRDLDSLYKATNDLDYLSDKGLLLILLKKYEKAIQLYLEIEKKKPGRYSTASNLGTVYELAGQNENALKWIKKAIEIDPNSHNGSEWLHEKVLEAKLKGEQYFTSRFLLNTDFGSELLPSTSLTHDELNNLSHVLYYQLNERVSFVKPKDKIVSQLMFDLGNVAFLLRNYYDAIDDYEQAKRYGFSDPLLEIRIKESERLKQMPVASLKRSKVKVYNSKIKYYIFGISAFVVLSLFMVVVLKRRKKAGRR